MTGDELMEMKLKDLVMQFAMPGAMMDQTEWDESADKFGEDFKNVLHTARSEIRMKIMGAMLRTDESE